jgi:hypothetical protein
LVEAEGGGPQSVVEERRDDAGLVGDQPCEPSAPSVAEAVLLARNVLRERGLAGGFRGAALALEVELQPRVLGLGVRAMRG